MGADVSYARRVAVHEEWWRHGAIPYRIGGGRRDDAAGLLNRECTLNKS